MAKVKYYYDSENLAYTKIRPKKRYKFGFALLFMIASGLFGFLMLLILMNSTYFVTPKSKMQTREIENLKTNFEILNRKISDMNEVLEKIEDRDNNVYRTFFNANPIGNEIRKSGIIGKNRYKELQGFNNSKLVTNTSQRVDNISKALAIQSKSLDEILKLAKKKDKLLSSIPAIQPVKNEELKRVASGFGYRSDPFTKARKMHKGMDFTAKTGTPIYASGDGIVKNADASKSGYGNHIEISHGFGYLTLYAHLSKYNVRPGQRIKRGDVIGFVGSTGRSEAPHLHYEVHKDGKAVNPLNFYYGNISAAEYVVITRIANQENQSLD